MIEDARSALAEVVRICGGQSGLARKCKVKPQTVQIWLKMGRLPAARAIAVEEAVNGQVTRYELRPDIYPDEMRIKK